MKPEFIYYGRDQGCGRESATAFAAIYFLMQDTPFIYQGQEIGMRGKSISH
jgi:alpha-glucosidase